MSGYYRVKLLIGVDTYGEGETPEDAVKNVFDTISSHPPIEEMVYKMALINSKVDNKKSLTFDEVVSKSS